MAPAATWRATASTTQRMREERTVVAGQQPAISLSSGLTGLAQTHQQTDAKRTAGLPAVEVEGKPLRRPNGMLPGR